MAESADRAKCIFLAAIENFTPEQWPAYLDSVCWEDRESRRQVEQLLQAHIDLSRIRTNERRDSQSKE